QPVEGMPTLPDPLANWSPTSKQVTITSRSELSPITDLDANRKRSSTMAQERLPPLANLLSDEMESQFTVNWEFFREHDTCRRLVGSEAANIIWLRKHFINGHGNLIPLTEVSDNRIENIPNWTMTSDDMQSLVTEHVDAMSIVKFFENE